MASAIAPSIAIAATTCSQETVARTRSIAAPTPTARGTASRGGRDDPGTHRRGAATKAGARASGELDPSNAMTWLTGAGFAAVLAAIAVMYARMRARAAPSAMRG